MHQAEVKQASIPSLPWTGSVQDLLLQLKSSPATGLSPSEASVRRQIFGANSLETEQPSSKLQRLLGQVRNPVFLTLFIAALLSTLLKEWMDAIAIFAILVVNTLIGFVQENKADRAIKALKSMAAPAARVRRDRQIIRVKADELVPGDIVILEAGDYIAADLRIISSYQLSADESIMSGESFPASKAAGELPPATSLHDRSSMLFAGTALLQGSGEGLVTATGMRTELGRIASLMQEAKTQPTPLQARMAEANRVLLLAGGLVVVIMVLLGALRGFTWLDITFSALSLAIAAIPEGLPTIVSLALSMAVSRMSKKKAIVRHLPAVETLGSCDVICTDKTGTLTTGHMQVRELILRDGQIISLPSGRLTEQVSVIRDFMHTAVLASNASFSAQGLGLGDPTEVALLELVHRLDYSADEIRAGAEKKAEWSFDAGRKRMSVLSREGEDWTIHVKGAPESLLTLCQLQPTELALIEAAMQSLAQKGRRLLALARRQVKPEEQALRDAPNGIESREIERELSLLGLVAIADPPRPESAEAIKNCQNAGIEVVMITGDHPLTAGAIARELGILDGYSKQASLTGAEIDLMSEQEFLARVTEIKVYARVTPEHKLRIIEAWQKHGKIVAMTGDGVNDAPALKAASIGIAMGQGGTEVARQASSVILTDDNFATIVAAIEEGRGIYGNIKRTILYLLTGNFAEILLMLGAIIIGMPIPLLPIHLLWINLVTDGLPSLALAAEPLPQNLLASSQKPSSSSFFDRSFRLEIILVGMLTAGLALLVFSYNLQHGSLDEARSAAFSFLVFEELFRSFAYRSSTETWLSPNCRISYFHLLAVGLPLGLQFMMNYLPSFAVFFSYQSVHPNELLALMALALVPVTMLELRKICRTRRRPRSL